MRWVGGVTRIVNRVLEGRNDGVNVVHWSPWVGGMDVILVMIVVHRIVVIVVPNLRVRVRAVVDRRGSMTVVGIILIPHHLLLVAPLVAHLFQNEVAEVLGDVEGRVEDFLEGRIRGGGLGERHAVVHGTPLEAIPVSVIVHDGLHDAGIGQVVLRKSRKLSTLENVHNRDRIYRERVVGVVVHVKANVLQGLVVEIA